MPYTLHTIDLKTVAFYRALICGVVQIFCDSYNTFKNLGVSNQKLGKKNEKIYFKALLMRLKNLKMLETLDL